MIYGLIASNDDETRCFAVSADSEEQAIKYVSDELGSEYRLELEVFEEMLSDQYSQLAELTTL